MMILGAENPREMTPEDELRVRAVLAALQISAVYGPGYPGGVTREAAAQRTAVRVLTLFGERPMNTLFLRVA